MRWFTANATTIGMAIVLSLLTIGLLTKPEEDEVTLLLTATFLPDIRTQQFGSLEFSREDGSTIAASGDFMVSVSGPAAQVHTGLRLTCQPILDESKFSNDTRETTIRITVKDFNLPADPSNRITIKPFNLKIRYAPMVTKLFPIQASVEDIMDRNEAPRFRVDAVRAIPPEIPVRLPVDKAERLTALPIMPIRMKGRTSSYMIEGAINRTGPDLKDAKARETFMIAIDLSPIREQAAVKDVPLFLSSPPIPGCRVELIDKMTYTVVLEGPRDLLDQLVQKPELIHVFARLVWRANSEPGTYSVAVQCELVDESLRKQVKVSLAPGEPPIAGVKVTRN